MVGSQTESSRENSRPRSGGGEQDLEGEISVPTERKSVTVGGRCDAGKFNVSAFLRCGLHARVHGDGKQGGT